MDRGLVLSQLEIFVFRLKISSDGHGFFSFKDGL